MKRRAGKKPEWQKRMARERIELLFRKAGEEFRDNPERSHRYVQLARRIGMRYNIRMPKSARTRICKFCHRYLVHGANSRVRTRKEQQAVIVKCLECGHVMRYPYRKEKNLNR